MHVHLSDFTDTDVLFSYRLYVCVLGTLAAAKMHVAIQFHILILINLSVWKLCHYDPLFSPHWTPSLVPIISHFDHDNRLNITDDSVHTCISLCLDVIFGSRRTGGCLSYNDTSYQITTDDNECLHSGTNKEEKNSCLPGSSFLLLILTVF